MTAVEDVPISAAGNPIGFGSMKRVEDQRFVRGQGNYVDDVNLPGMLHSAILRSPFAHARINCRSTRRRPRRCRASSPSSRARRSRASRVRRSSATTSRGCRRCRTTPRPCWPPTRCASRARRSRTSSPRAATSRRTRWSSSTSTTSPLPPVMDAKKALDADAPVIRDDKGQTDNRITDVHGNQTWESGNKEATEAAFAAAEADPELRRRRGGHPLPARAPGADGDVRLGRRTSTRSPAS